VKIPTHPSHPERVCWGCAKLCPAADLACGNGTIRTLHPVELFGDDWVEYFNPPEADAVAEPHEPPVVAGFPTSPASRSRP
jgi:hypothetical protein